MTYYLMSVESFLFVNGIIYLFQILVDKTEDSYALENQTCDPAVEAWCPDHEMAREVAHT